MSASTFCGVLRLRPVSTGRRRCYGEGRGAGPWRPQAKGQCTKASTFGGGVSNIGSNAAQWHALVKLSRTIDWSFLEERLGMVYKDKPGRSPLPTRLMAGLGLLPAPPTPSAGVV